MGVQTSTGTEHRYQTCSDPFCDRFPCRVYQEGRRRGFDEGHRKGFDDGYIEGYSEGVRDCPLPHQ